MECCWAASVRFPDLLETFQLTDSSFSEFLSGLIPSNSFIARHSTIRVKLHGVPIPHKFDFLNDVYRTTPPTVQSEPHSIQPSTVGERTSNLLVPSSENRPYTISLNPDLSSLSAVFQSDSGASVPIQLSGDGQSRQSFFDSTQMMQNFNLNWYPAVYSTRQFVHSNVLCYQTY